MTTRPHPGVPRLALAVALLAVSLGLLFLLSGKRPAVRPDLGVAASPAYRPMTNRFEDNVVVRHWPAPGQPLRPMPPSFVAVAQKLEFSTGGSYLAVKAKEHMIAAYREFVKYAEITEDQEVILRGMILDAERNLQHVQEQYEAEAAITGPTTRASFEEQRKRIWEASGAVGDAYRRQRDELEDRARVILKDNQVLPFKAAVGSFLFPGVLMFQPAES